MALSRVLTSIPSVERKEKKGRRKKRRRARGKKSWGEERREKQNSDYCKILVKFHMGW